MGMISSCSTNPDHRICICSTLGRLGGRAVIPPQKTALHEPEGADGPGKLQKVPVDSDVQHQGEAQSWMTPSVTHSSCTPPHPRQGNGSWLGVWRHKCFPHAHTRGFLALHTRDFVALNSGICGKRGFSLIISIFP